MIGEAGQLFLVVFILGGIILISRAQARRQGQANPFDTGDLGGQIGEVGARVGRVEAQLGVIERDVRRLDDEAASKGDVKRVEKALLDLKSEVAELAKSASSREATLDHVKQQVDRLYNVIVNKGMGA